MWKGHFNTASATISAKIPHQTQTIEHTFQCTMIWGITHTEQNKLYNIQNMTKKTKVKSWKNTHPDANYFFCPRCIDSDCNSTATESKKGEVYGSTAKQS